MIKALEEYPLEKAYELATVAGAHYDVNPVNS